MVTGTMLVAIALKTALLLGGTLVACTFLERRSAACRHLLWTLGLALSLILPFAASALPAMVTIVLPWSHAGQQAPAFLHTTAAGPWLTGSTIAGIWLAGVVVLLARQAIALAGLGRWAREAHPLRDGCGSKLDAAVEGRSERLRSAAAARGLPYHAISAATGAGIAELRHLLAGLLRDAPPAGAAAEGTA